MSFKERTEKVDRAKRESKTAAMHERAAELDIKNNDYLTITAKADSREDIIHSYEMLGWRLLDVREDKQYIDLDVIDFVRDHKIPNKDKLQLMQVRLETYLNKFGEARHKKYRKSAILAISGYLVAFLLFAAGIALLVTGMDDVGTFAVAVISLALGVILLPGISIAFRRVRLHEAAIYAATVSAINANIEKLCMEANLLVCPDRSGPEESETAQKK